MSIGEVISNFFGYAGRDDDYEEDNYEEDIEIEEPVNNVLNSTLRRSSAVQNSNGGRNTGNVINLQSRGGYSNTVVIIKPNVLDDAGQVTEYLRERRTIFLNLEGVNEALSQRILDFVSGSVYALDADIQRAANAVFVVAPSNVEVQPLKNDLKFAKGFFPFANGNNR